jgi:hypothetical protein
MCFALLLCAAGTVAAADGEIEQDERESAEAHEWTSGVMREVDCRLVGEAATALRAIEKPVLVWSCPEVGRVHGDTYLLTVGGNDAASGGRPVAAVSLFQWFDPWQSRNGEFVSLADRPIRLHYAGRTLWDAPASGLAWSPLEGVARPLGTKGLRLAQMRAAAARFSASLVDLRTDEAGVPRPLRLLRTPVYRYEDAGAGVTDGAVFTFALGTDPEALLLIEARSEGKTSAWHYRLARMNDTEITFLLDGQHCHRFERVPRADCWNPKLPYTKADFTRIPTAN